MPINTELICDICLKAIPDGGAHYEIRMQAIPADESTGPVTLLFIHCACLPSVDNGKLVLMEEDLKKKAPSPIAPTEPVAPTDPVEPPLLIPPHKKE